jgi:hypothetical protein
MEKPTNVNGFQVFPEEPPPNEFAALVHAHSDRLRALLDRPVILAVHWDAGDACAVVQIMPADSKASHTSKPFAEFELPFPEGGAQTNR